MGRQQHFLNISAYHTNYYSILKKKYTKAMAQKGSKKFKNEKKGNQIIENRDFL